MAYRVTVATRPSREQFFKIAMKHGQSAGLSESEMYHLDGLPEDQLRTKLVREWGYSIGVVDKVKDAFKKIDDFYDALTATRLKAT